MKAKIEIFVEQFCFDKGHHNSEAKNLIRQAIEEFVETDDYADSYREMAKLMQLYRINHGLSEVKYGKVKNALRQLLDESQRRSTKNMYLENAEKFAEKVLKEVDDEKSKD